MTDTDPDLARLADRAGPLPAAPAERRGRPGWRGALGIAVAAALVGAGSALGVARATG